MPPRRAVVPSEPRTESLAYVFFHRPRRGVPRREYERALARFHSRIARGPPTGIRESAVFLRPRAPWAEPRARPIYVDWYIVEGFHALDPIRSVAYHPPWVDAHREVARLCARGWGSLYATRRWAHAPGRGERITWFAASARTERWREQYLRADRSVGTLWRRQLALGPGPEFCYVAPGPPPEPLVGAGRRVATVPVPASAG